MPASSILIDDLGLVWPDGSVALSGITGSFSDRRTGLIGANGAGKSTLLRLIAGELAPTTGGVTTSGEVDYLPQTLTHARGATVADLLGLHSKIVALRAIEGGDVDAAHFEVLGDDWDIETRAAESLREVGLRPADLDRPAGSLSGGEAMLVAIAGIRARRSPIALLDEPTNSLDRDARRMLGELIEGWTGTLVVTSHDTALLDRMDETAELYGGRLSVFGGPYSAWRAHLDQEQAAAVHAVRSAEQSVKVEKRQRLEAESKLAQRARVAKKAYADKRLPKIVMNARAGEAQVSAGRHRGVMEHSLIAARSALDAAEARVRDDEHIHLTLPDPDVARGRRIAELTGGTGSFVIQGPEKVALIGPNGVGKTTLLDRLVTGSAPGPVAFDGTLHTDRVGYLRQRLDGLDGGSSALDSVQAAAPSIPTGELRNQLARLLLRGDSVLRPVATLSGGERFRVALACLLFADPPIQLMVLDEPTNDLDRESVDRLVEALAGYRGALLVVSHDDVFLARLGLDAVLELGRDGSLTVR